MGGFAWVTLATNDSYSLGALVLAHSLKQAGTVHQLAVLVTPGVTKAMREKLETVFDLVKEVNILDSKDEANLRLLKRPELGVTFTKLHCWTLTQFDKCVFLDADTLVLQNSDELFERDEFSAAPDVGWPDCFNSGVFVYCPSMQTYESLIQFALEKGSFDGGDQGLLNLFFSDWAHKDISKHLPFIYNMCSTACYSYLPAFKQFGSNAKIIHFIGNQKPWLQYFNTETQRVQPSGDSSHLEGVLQRWWDIFCSLIHPHLSPAMAGLAGAFSQLTLGVARTAEQDVLENVLRKQAWEVGNIDYLGKDSFDKIWSKISETLSSGQVQATVAEVVSPTPAESQSETVTQQETQSSDQISPSLEKIESSLVYEETKTPKTEKTDNVCPIKTAAVTKPLTCPLEPKLTEQKPIAPPLVPPELPVTSSESFSPPVSKETESSESITKDEVTDPKPIMTAPIEATELELSQKPDAPKEPPSVPVVETSTAPIEQTKVASVTLKDSTLSPIEQAPASVVTPLIPQHDTPTESMVREEEPQTSTGSTGPTEQPLATHVIPKELPQVLTEPPLKTPLTPEEKPQVLTEEPPKAPVARIEQSQVSTEPLKHPFSAPVIPTEQSPTEVSTEQPLPSSVAPAQESLILTKTIVPAEQISLEQLVQKEKLEPPAETILATPPITAPISCELKPATFKAKELVESSPLQEIKKPSVESTKQDKPDEGVGTPVVTGAVAAKGVDEVQSQTVAEAGAPSKDKSEGSKDAAAGATPTPPPRKSDKPKKGASKAKK